MHTFFQENRILRKALLIPTLILAATIAAPHLSATLLSSASVTLGGACTGAQTVTGTSSASVTLPCGSGSASASANSSFDTAVPSLSTLAFSDSAGFGDVSTSTASFDYELVVLGGTGTGFLALDFDSSIGGNKDAQASASSSFVEMLNGINLNSGSLCAGPIATGGAFSCSSSTVPIGFGFTYGTPFELSFALTGIAGGGLGGASISGSGDFNYAILTTGSSLPNPGGTLNMVPEPSSPALLLSAALMLLILSARKRLGIRKS